MDSTTQSQSHPNPNNPLSASKLPVKRKIPDSKPPVVPPFKFHRIWTEPDEITFLQALLDSSSQDLAFPRDLPLFFSRFSATMSQPYTKSQLSEKLRRLRKKFRLISTRLGKGLDPSLLSLHDQALFDLCKRLWHPDYSSTSPFSGVRNLGNNNGNAAVVSGDHGSWELDKSTLVGIRVNFSPTLPVDVSNQGISGNRFNLGVDSSSEIGEAMLSEVNVELEREEMAFDDDQDGTFGTDIGSEKFVAGKKITFGCGNRIGEGMAKVVVDVLDESVKDVRRRLVSEKAMTESFHMRWKQQRIAELDVLRSRLRLILENSLTKH